MRRTRRRRRHCCPAHAACCRGCARLALQRLLCLHAATADFRAASS
jgi:hypothetical protein